MKTIEQKLALLDETAAFFNSSNRCETALHSCRYWMDGKAGCAIGRKIKDKELCRKLDNGDTTSVNSDCVFNALPKDLQEYGRQYLKDLQQLHDESYYWNSAGLSEAGKIAFQDIRNKVLAGEI